MIARRERRGFLLQRLQRRHGNPHGAGAFSVECYSLSAHRLAFAGDAGFTVAVSPDVTARMMRFTRAAGGHDVRIRFHPSNSIHDSSSR
jgi:hypothetical protein